MGRAQGQCPFEAPGGKDLLSPEMEKHDRNFHYF